MHKPACIYVIVSGSVHILCRVIGLVCLPFLTNATSRYRFRFNVQTFDPAEEFNLGQ